MLFHVSCAVGLVRCPESDVDWVFEADTVGTSDLPCEEPLINWLLPGEFGM